MSQKRSGHVKSLLDYDLLTNDVFYRCWHILDYIAHHPNLPESDHQAIEATIMEALVSKKLLDPTKESLDLQNLCIHEDLNHYCYEKHPNICGIPLWMKEEFRKHSLYITGGIPISLCLSKPPSKIIRYCVYDPNTAVSSIFTDATFYQAYYVSPTRHKRIEEVRPFVEVNIDGEPYLVDILTKRILKSSWFKETFSMEVVSREKKSEFSSEQQAIYDEQVSPSNSLAIMIPLYQSVLSFSMPDHAETAYELEKSKEYFPEEWQKSALLEKEKDDFFSSQQYQKENNRHRLASDIPL